MVPGSTLIHFSSPDKFREWHFDFKADIYLIDYEFLGSSETGLNLIEECDLQKKSILVTSRFEEEKIQERCLSLGVRLIPKGLASYIPINFKKIIPLENAKTKVRYDVCLIDDDKDLVHSVWNLVAKTNDLKIKMFTTPEEFLTTVEFIDKETPIYVDVSLGNGVKGTDFVHVIHKLGFDEIFLATGYDKDAIEVPSFVRGVVGKDFPEAMI